MDLKDRGRALEEQFFQQEEARQIAAFRAAMQRAASKEELRRTSGIHEEAELDRLVALGISAGTLAAVSLVPLIEVAWADGQVQDHERDAILRAAHGKGIDEGSDGYGLLTGWLEQRPPHELFSAWVGYLEALEERLTTEQIKLLHRQVVDRARAVAAAAGGFLGLGKISAAEERVLERLEAAFDRA